MNKNFLLFLNLRLKYDDNELKIWQKYFNYIAEYFALFELVPLSTLIFRREYLDFICISQNILEILEKRIVNRIEERKNDHPKNDMLDVLVDLREKYLSNGKINEKELCSRNLAFLLHDLFIGGIETNSSTMYWLVLYIFTNKNIENILREEIKCKIGNRTPIQNDMHNCHYVMACIAEILRLRNPAPFGLPHKLLDKYNLG